MECAKVKKQNVSGEGTKTRTRDQELVRFVGRHGVVSVEHVMEAMGVGRTAAYRRVAACIEGGLLERLAVLRSEPSLLRATRSGLRYAGLGLAVATVSPGAIRHSLICASVAQRVVRANGENAVMTERELVLAERIEGEAIASAEVGRPRGGRARLHRPDLVVFREGERIAVEVELTPKAPYRLDELIRAWRRALCVEEVHYLCEPGQTHRAVERAVARVRADQKVTVIEGVPR
jgi:hypothetical protein